MLQIRAEEKGGREVKPGTTITEIQNNIRRSQEELQRAKQAENRIKQKPELLYSYLGINYTPGIKKRGDYGS